jgi:hypothetical protein
VLPSWVLIAVSLTVVLGYGLLISRRRTNSQRAMPDWNWALDFSLEKYRPMQRLLCQEDYAFLKTQPGYEPSMARTLRKGRCRVFRSYLRSLHRDFDGLYYAAKVMVLNSESDQTDLVQVIFRQRMFFYWALFLVECRLALYTLGLGTVDVRPVLGALEAMRDATQILQPVGV